MPYKIIDGEPVFFIESVVKQYGNYNTHKLFKCNSF